MAANENNSQINFGQLSSTLSTVGKAFVVSKVWKLVALIVIGLGAAIYFIVRAIKKSALKEIPLPELPSGEVTDPNNGINTTEQFKNIARQYADEVYSITNDWFVLDFTKEKTFKKLWALNNTQLVYVYRVFSTLYYTKNNETMTKAIDDEINVVWDIDGGLKNKLVSRLKSLGAN